jgi:PTS system beta-glucosides-specific IIC component
MIIAFVVGTIVSILFGIKEEEGDAEALAQFTPGASTSTTDKANRVEASVDMEDLDAPAPTGSAIAYAPMTGRAILLQEVNDPTFGDELMGKGVAFVPTLGELVSPVTGTVMNVFKTKHAIVIRSDEGMELLIHVGINTVKLRGQYFEAHVATGTRVQAGDLLLTFELDQIARDYDITTAMVVTNTADYKEIKPIQLGNIQMGENVLKANL